MKDMSKVIIMGIMLIVIGLVIPIGLGIMGNINNYVIDTQISGEEGLFPATYSFTEDTTGDTGTDISFIDSVDIQGSNTQIEVSETLGNHDKILKMTDNYVAGYIKVSNDFTPQTYGTIEFWIRTNDATMGTTILFRDSIDDNAKIQFLIVLDDFRYWCASGYETSSYDPTTENDLWYHIRIDFRCNGASEYMGLGTGGKWRIFVNGIDANITGNIGYGRTISNLSKCQIVSDMSDSNYNTYFDAIGYIWDNYDIGNNLYDTITEDIYLSEIVDPSVLILLSMMIPLVAIIGLALLFLPKNINKK